MGKTCFFIGHRDAPASVMPDLQAAIERHIVEYGVTEFIVGGYGAFDSMAARAVAGAKQRHAHITLTRLLAYHPAQRPQILPEYFDDSWYPEGLAHIPRRLAIVKANEIAVRHADCIIYYLAHIGSNTRRMVEYALRLSESLPIVFTALPSGGK